MKDYSELEAIEWCDENWIVTAIDPVNMRYCIMNKRGISKSVPLDSIDFRKTGNNYPQMADVLQQLGGGSDSR